MVFYNIEKLRFQLISGAGSVVVISLRRLGFGDVEKTKDKTEGEAKFFYNEIHDDNSFCCQVGAADLGQSVNNISPKIREKQ